MKPRPRSVRTDRDPEPPTLGRYAGYDDGDDHVVCDRTDARAWIRSSRPIHRVAFVSHCTPDRKTACDQVCEQFQTLL